MFFFSAPSAADFRIYFQLETRKCMLKKVKTFDLFFARSRYLGSPLLLFVLAVTLFLTRKSMFFPSKICRLCKFVFEDFAGNVVFTRRLHWITSINCIFSRCFIVVVVGGGGELNFHCVRPRLTETNNEVYMYQIHTPDCWFFALDLRPYFSFHLPSQLFRIHTFLYSFNLHGQTFRWTKRKRENETRKKEHKQKALLTLAYHRKLMPTSDWVLKLYKGKFAEIIIFNFSSFRTLSHLVYMRFMSALFSILCGGICMRMVIAFFADDDVRNMR